MDKRYTTLSLPQQLALRRQAINDVLAHPEWSLPQAIRHLKKTMRVTSLELAKLSGVAFRTLQDIEQERSEGNVQTINRILGVLGLKLGVVSKAPSTVSDAQGHQAEDDDPEV
ncbi:MAG: transcriptional regulator [Pseudomonadota bacterium]